MFYYLGKPSFMILYRANCRNSKAHRPAELLSSQGLLIQPPLAEFAQAEYCVALMAAQATTEHVIIITRVTCLHARKLGRHACATRMGHRTELDLRRGHVDHGQQVQQLLVAGAALRRACTGSFRVCNATSQENMTHAAGQEGWSLPGLTSLMKPRMALQHLHSSFQGVFSAPGKVCCRCGDTQRVLQKGAQPGERGCTRSWAWARRPQRP
jgi:hypothetical protein